MKPLRTLSIRSRPTSIQFLEKNQVGIISTDGSFRIVDTVGFDQLVGFKSNTAKIDTRLHNNTLSSNGRVAAYFDAHENKIMVVDIQDKKILYYFHGHDDGINAIRFDHSRQYIASGGEDGKVYLRDTAEGEVLMHLAPHPDYVSLCAFNEDDTYFISTDYAGNANITSLATDRVPIRKKIFEHARIISLQFLPHHKILFGSDKGEVILYDYINNRQLKKVIFEAVEIRRLGVSANQQFLFVQVGTFKFALLDLEKLEILVERFLVLEEEVTAFASSPDCNLFVLGLANGKISFYELQDDSDLKAMVDDGEYRMAYEAIEQNPLLKLSDQLERLEMIWNDTLKQAIELMGEEKKEEADQLLEPFLNIKGKSEAITRLHWDFARYPQLQEAVQKKHYIAIYATAEKYPYLRRSKIFLEIEEVWKKTYRDAKELIFMHNNFDMAKKALEPFYRVPEKMQVIHNLLRNSSVFREMLELMKRKDFRRFFGLTLRHKYLQKTPEYEQVLAYGDRLFHNVKNKIENRQFQFVLTEIARLMHFRHLEDQVDEIKEFANAAHKLIEQYKAKRYQQCFQMIDEHPFLADLPEAKELERTWRRKIYEAEQNAKKGNIFGVKFNLGDLINVETRHPRIGQLFKKASQVQIRKLVEMKTSNDDFYKRAIMRYLTMFGYDSEIAELIQEVKKQHDITIMLGENQKKKRDGSQWFNVTKGHVPDFVTDVKVEVG